MRIENYGSFCNILGKRNIKSIRSAMLGCIPAVGLKLSSFKKLRKRIRELELKIKEAD